MNINNLVCACCSGTDFKFIHRLPEIIFKRTATIYQCKSCECGVTHPAPVIEENYYTNNVSYDESFTKNSIKFEGFAADLLSVIEEVVDANSKCRLLDVACGGGFMVSEAKKRGFEAVGVDTNESVVRWALEQGHNVVLHDIYKYDELVTDPFDVVVFSHILEHLSDPAELLSKYCKTLNAGGYIVLSQTNHLGLLPKYLPWIWYGWQPQEHFWHFTSKSLEELGSSLGLELVMTKKNSLHHEFSTSGGLVNIAARWTAAIVARLGMRVSSGDSVEVIFRMPSNVKANS